MTDRQALAFANPVADPSGVESGPFRVVQQIAGGVLITILTVNR